MYQKYLLLLLQVIAHAFLIYAFFSFGIVDWAISIFVYFLTGCLGISVTFHRYLAHKSWNAPRWWVYLGSILGTYGIQGSPIAWANNHVAHHRYVDTDKDPHSPITMPWWKVQWFSMLTPHENFRFAIKNMNPFQNFIHRYYFMMHASVILALSFFVGLHMLAVLYFVPAAILWNLANLVNTLNHSRFGYRNYDTKDFSTNHFITGILSWGEGWHNNHHYRAGSPKFGHKWYEFDPSYLFIRIIGK